MEAILVSQQCRICFFQVQKNKVPFSIRGLILVLVVALPMVGCGGGGGGSASDPVTVRTQDAVIGTAGGSLDFPGEVKLDIPSNFIPDGTVVQLNLYSKPFAVSPVAENYPSGIEVTFSNPVSDSEAEFDLTINAPKTQNEIGWTAALESGADLDFPANLPARISDSQVKITLKGSDLVQLQSPGRLPPGPRVRISPSKPRFSGSSSAGKFYRPKFGTFNNGLVLEEVPANASLINLKVAIVIHGLNNDATGAVDTAALAEKAFADSPGGPYQAIWLYNYHDTASGVSTNAARMAESLASHGIAQAKRVDIFGHSMGGLVARWAIEKEGLGAHVDRLFTFGTPHLGVPAPVLGILEFYVDLRTGTRDLLSDSAFITSLNKTPSPYKDQILYCTFVGSDHDYKGIVGNKVAKKYENYFGWTGAVDGIVAGYSASPQILGQFGVRSNTTEIYKFLNHSDIGGSPSLQSDLEFMLRTQVGGVIK